MTRLDAFLAQRHRPVLMGIVNVTPNSFSDTARHLEPAAAIAHGRQLAAEGAAILDLGAEASSFFRPGVVGVDAAEQLRRLLPVVTGLAGGEALLSIDTRLADVARACVGAGAAIINDISAGEFDAAMLPTVAELGAGVVLMHISPGYPATPEQDDSDIVATVGDYLAKRVAAAEAAGISRRRIMVDPGVGFGKTMADNWRLVAGLGRLAALGCPVVLGISRKRFLTTLPGAQGLSPEARDPLTAMVTALAAADGVPIHRVHNVALAAQALAAAGAMKPV